MTRWRLPARFTWRRPGHHLVAAGIVILGAAVATFAAITLSGGARAYQVSRLDRQIAPALEARIGHETGGQLTTVHFYSEALHKQADYLVYLPAGYSPRQPLPVFYLLHGMPGKPVAFTVNANVEVRLETLIHRRRVTPMILVFPDGRIDGRTASDSEWANTPAGNYESYVTDVVHNVDDRYPALACRQERAIAGLSAGAYGAANVGLHHTATFGLIQVWSGYFSQTRTGVFARADRALIADNSPIDYVHGMRGVLRQNPLRLFLYAGRDDADHSQVAHMAALLKAEGAHVGWRIYPGGHSWNTWTAHVDRMLVMASHDFRHPLGAASPSCGSAPLAPEQ